MAKKRPSVQKRQREFEKRERTRRKAEKAARKREKKEAGANSEALPSNPLQPEADRDPPQQLGDQPT